MGGAGNSLVMEKDVPLLRPLNRATVAPCAVVVVSGDGGSKPMGRAPRQGPWTLNHIDAHGFEAACSIFPIPPAMGGVAHT